MSRRSIIAGIFVLGTTLLSAMYYEFYFAVGRMSRVALIETGDTSYYPPENHFWVAVRIALFTSVLMAVGIALLLAVLYAISRVVCNRQVQEAILEHEDLGTDYSVIKDCHWYSFSWSVSWSLPDGDKYTRSNSEDYFEEVPFVHS